MINKRTIPIAILLLLIAALAVAGASQVAGYKTAPGQVIVATGAPQSTGNPYPAIPASPALPAPSGQVAFSDSFDSTTLGAGWHSLSGSEGVWKVLKSGLLSQAGSSNDGDISNEDAVFVNDSAILGDGTFETVVYPTSGDPVGVVFRGSDSGYYRLVLLPNLNGNTGRVAKATLQKVTGDKIVEVASNKTWVGYNLGQWQRVQVTTTGSHVLVSVDGAPVIDTNDSSFGTGWVGVYTLADRAAMFDNVRVQRSVAGR
jgi:hypothetical protein